MAERRDYIHVKAMSSIHDKATRAQAFRGRLAQGKVMLPHGAPWTDDLVSELMVFDAGKHDDQVDAASLIGRPFRHSWTPQASHHRLPSQS